MSSVVERREIYAGRVLDVNVETHRMPDGRESAFEIVRHPGGAAVLPVLPDGQVLMIRQFRPALGEMIYEIPAGRIEPDEPPYQCAARELQEETGYSAEQIKSLGGFWSTPGFCDEYIHLYCAFGLTETEQQLEPDEVIELCPMPLNEALLLIAKGEISDSKTMLALLQYQQVVSGGSL